MGKLKLIIIKYFIYQLNVWSSVFFLNNPVQQEFFALTLSLWKIRQVSALSFWDNFKKYSHISITFKVICTLHWQSSQLIKHKKYLKSIHTIIIWAMIEILLMTFILANFILIDNLYVAWYMEKKQKKCSNLFQIKT